MNLRVCVLALLLIACSRDVEHRPTPSAPKGTLALGEPITSRFVSLGEIAKNPAAYQRERITTGGKVIAVCQEMGCWMEIKDEASQAHVKMHGHSFYVPRTSAGHMARVQANVLPAGTAHCEESPSPQATADLVELDATGVELD